MANDARQQAALQFSGAAVAPPADMLVYAAEAVYTGSAPPAHLERVTFSPFAGNVDRATIPANQRKIAVLLFAPGQAPPHLKRVALVT